MKRTYRLTAEPDGQGGYSPVTLDKSKLGFSPADTLVNFQVSAADLDGGDYSVQFLPVDAYGYVNFEMFVQETSACLMSQGFLFDSVKVSFNNVGNAGEPKVVFTFMSRSF